MSKMDAKTQTMSGQLLEIAERIREMRRVSGFSEEEMAQKTDTSLAEYRQYEAGALDFPFTFIHKCAIAFGIVIGLFFALFVVKLRSDEFIIGCALNTFAAGATAYLSRAIFGLSGTSGYTVPHLPTVRIPLIEDIPFLGEILSGNSVFIYITWLLVIVMWLFIYKTPYGFWIRAAGEQPETLRTAGISPERMKWIASILCGVFCGMAGAHLSLGYLNGSFVEGMSASRGYIAFACVIFAAANPSKAYLAALMFGFFDALGLRLQNYISSDLTATIPYIITVVMMVYVVVRGQKRHAHRMRAGNRI
mgnify:CR=1 FL=1